MYETTHEILYRDHTILRGGEGADFGYEIREAGRADVLFTAVSIEDAMMVIDECLEDLEGGPEALTCIRCLGECGDCDHRKVNDLDDATLAAEWRAAIYNCDTENEAEVERVRVYEAEIVRRIQAGTWSSPEESR